MRTVVSTNLPMGKKVGNNDTVSTAHALPICISCFARDNVNGTPVDALQEKTHTNDVSVLMVEFPFSLTVKRLCELIDQTVIDYDDGDIITSYFNHRVKSATKDSGQLLCIQQSNYHKLCDVGISSLNPHQSGVLGQ